MKAVLSVLALILFASSNAFAQAQQCQISMDRTPCPGKETEARKPYGGKNPTQEKSKAKTEAECVADAEKQVKIVRKGTLAKKVATVKFDGKDLGAKEHSLTCQ